MILAGVCYSFKAEVLKGVHSESDVYKVALFTSSASLGPQATSYAGQDGEVSGIGYTTGGKDLPGFSVGLTGAVAFLSFSDVTWENSTIQARGGLIYNASKGNRAVAVVDFGKDFTSTDGPFLFKFPPNNAETALIALT